MRQIFFVLALWGSVSIFTQTDIFPRGEDKKISELYEIIERQIIRLCDDNPTAEVCELLSPETKD